MLHLVHRPGEGDLAYDMSMLGMMHSISPGLRYTPLETETKDLDGMLTKHDALCLRTRSIFRQLPREIRVAVFRSSECRAFLLHRFECSMSLASLCAATEKRKKLGAHKDRSRVWDAEFKTSLG